MYRDYAKKATAGRQSVELGGARAMTRVVENARREQERDPTLSMQDAIARVFKKQPDLYERYLAENVVQV
jgi:hypothetical protein